MKNRIVVVLGASPNPERYSYLAANMLRDNNFPITLIGKKKGEVAGEEIITETPEKLENVDTITMYVGAKNQPEYYPFILNSKPKRILFNPGAENAELASLAMMKGIEVEEACTLVLLRTGQF